VGVESAGDQEHPESVVVAVAVAVGDSPVQFDEAVDAPMSCQGVLGALCAPGYVERDSTGRGARTAAERASRFGIRCGTMVTRGSKLLGSVAVARGGAHGRETVKPSAHSSDRAGRPAVSDWR